MTKIRCWPGCVAEIIGAPTNPENLGKFVTVIRKANHGEALPNGIWVNLEGFDGAAWIIEGHNLYWSLSNGTVAVVGTRSIGDKYLRPITPDPASISDEEVRDLWLPTPSTSVETV